MVANLVRNFCRGRWGLFKKPFFSENELLRMIMNGFLSSLEMKARDRNVKSRAFDFMIIAIKMINLEECSSNLGIPTPIKSPIS